MIVTLTDAIFSQYQGNCLAIVQWVEIRYLIERHSDLKASAISAYCSALYGSDGTCDVSQALSVSQRSHAMCMMFSFVMKRN